MLTFTRSFTTTSHVNPTRACICPSHLAGPIQVVQACGRLLNRGPIRHPYSRVGDRHRFRITHRRMSRRFNNCHILAIPTRHRLRIQIRATIRRFNNRCIHQYLRSLRRPFSNRTGTSNPCRANTVCCTTPTRATGMHLATSLLTRRHNLPLPIDTDRALVISRL